MHCSSRRGAVVAAALLLALAGPLRSANLLQNSGFESAGSTNNIPYWTFWRATWGAGGSAYTSTSQKVSGSRGLVLNCIDCSFGVYQQVNVTPGKHYQMNGWWRGSFTAGQTAWFDCELLDGPFDLKTADERPDDLPTKVCTYDPAAASWGWETMAGAYATAPICRNGIRKATGSTMTVVLKTGGFTDSHSVGYYDDISLQQVPSMSIVQAEASPNGTAVVLEGNVVTATFPGFFYIASPDRVAGIRVTAALYGGTMGQQAAVAGVVKTGPEGERYVDASTLSFGGVGGVRPLALSVEALSSGPDGPSPSTLGLLVRVSGRARYIDSHTFALSDGKGEVTCVTPSTVTVSPSLTHASVTGISSCAYDGSTTSRLLRVRKLSDITPVLP